MKKLIGLILIAFIGVGISCSNAKQRSEQDLVVISTEFGEIKLKLYDDTPEHKKNFLKLIDEGYYDGLLFHRVMENFMIQGGDPDSKDAAPGERLGSGNPGYTIPAEILPQHIHKKGALAAARRGTSNPEKRSSGSQFYIVHGEVYTPGKLDTMEMMMNSRAKNEFLQEKFAEAKPTLDEYRKNNDQDGFNIFVSELRATADSAWTEQPKFAFSDAQRQAYTTIGGYPSLDGEYTVFGEVVEGLDVLDKIAAVETDQYDRPKTDIKMEIQSTK
ncbi:peptidylprolyl isomerase [Draconibacterium halophilum]|uniref:Peptidyl-prolyl cis-trans isomerase n=1 Tax=Draconibacterium halophilum TaxID=2706887 RepID=A0A6C0RIB8_9BACT|nr:peptidylprolyl isomerase [Draconibacterium halophilum]QIA09837.1 peptidylprolyl isomerase [Draconibacterium halophilum]